MTPAIRRGNPALILAPMEGVTDYPMRCLLREVGCFGLSVTEFIRVSQEAPPPKVFYRHTPELRLPESERALISVQILGGDPEKMAESARVAERCGATMIDINFGCPAPTVNRNDGGATLLKFPCRIEGVVRAVREAVSPHIPVSAKLRLGWDDPTAIHVNAESAARGGASWITIHGRTRFQGYSPPAYWKPIGEVARSLDIPVIANGEIWSREDFLRCREESGCEHFMLGRGALADPLLSRTLAKELGIELPALPEWMEGSLGLELQSWAPILLRFTQIALPYFSSPGYVTRRMKQWGRFIAMKRPIPWFSDLKRIVEIDDIFTWLQAGQYLIPQPYAEVEAVVTGLPASTSSRAFLT